MAIAKDIGSSKLGTRITNTVTTNTFTTGGTNRLMVAFIAAADNVGSANNTTIATVTDSSGLTWHQAVISNSSQIGFCAAIWYTFAPLTLTNKTVTVTTSNSAATIFVDVVAFTGTATTGLDGYDAIGQTNNNTNTGTTASCAVVTNRAASWVWGVGMDPQSNATVTAAAGQTIDAQGHNTTDLQVHWAQRLTATTAAAGTTVTVSTTLSASDIWEMAAVEILAPAAAPPLRHALLLTGAGM